MDAKADARAVHDKWVAEYERWRGGEETQRDYCHKRGLSFYEFKEGVSEARKAGLIGASKQSVGFVPVKVVDGEMGPVVSQGDPYCEILFSGKRGIRIETEESISSLKLLLNYLR